MMTTVTGKNQLTVPAALARQLQIRPGTRVEWSVDSQGQVILKLLPSRAQLAKNACGMGQAWLKPGQSAVDELILERQQDNP